jgi:cell division protein FtsQ
MTSQQKPSRADTVRQRRSSQNPKETLKSGGSRVREHSKPASRQTSRTSAQKTSTSRQAYRPESVFLPVEPHPIAPTTLRRTFGVSSSANSKNRPGQRTSREQKGKRPQNSNRQGYDFTFSLGRTAVRAPVLSLPNLGSRWVSAGLTLLLVLLLYTMATANAFTVGTVELTGNQRLSTADVNASLGLIGQPSFTAIPSKIEEDLRIAFPDLADVKVKVGFPNSLQVAVVERMPILVWYQDGQPNWIDPNGFAFKPRGEVPGLVQIAASGDPPKPQEDPKKSDYEQAFIEPAMVQAILTLQPQVPEGAPMVFDPKYGMGWQDPQGWFVYFGQNTADIAMKKIVYQAILDTFSQKGIKPTLVSLAYLDAPFYK